MTDEQRDRKPGPKTGFVGGTAEGVDATDSMAPGDEAPAGTPGTGDDVCPDCHGSGRLGTAPCPNCRGTGRIVRAVGGA